MPRFRRAGMRVKFDECRDGWKDPRKNAFCVPIYICICERSGLLNRLWYRKEDFSLPHFPTSPTTKTKRVLLVSSTETLWVVWGSHLDSGLFHQAVFVLYISFLSWILRSFFKKRNDQIFQTNQIISHFMMDRNGSQINLHIDFAYFFVCNKLWIVKKFPNISLNLKWLPFSAHQCTCPGHTVQRGTFFRMASS
jgi:hypothetical protein